MCFRALQRCSPGIEATDVLPGLRGSTSHRGSFHFLGHAVRQGSVRHVDGIGCDRVGRAFDTVYQRAFLLRTSARSEVVQSGLDALVHGVDLKVSWTPLGGGGGYGEQDGGDVLAAGRKKTMGWSAG